MKCARPIVFLSGGLLILIALSYGALHLFFNRARDAGKTKSEPATSYPRLAALIPPPVPDDQNFAMTPFLAPLFDVKPNFKLGENRYRDPEAFNRAQNFAKDFPTPKMRGWEEGRKTDVTGWPLESFEEFAPVLDELRAASRRSSCRYNIRYQDGANALLPHLAVLKRLCSILSLRASALLAEGRADQAFEDISMSFYLADTIKNEPVLISHLVRLACLQATLQPIYEGLAERRWSDAQLVDLQTRVQKADPLAELKAALRGEQAFGNQIIEQLRDRHEQKEIAALFPGEDARALSRMSRAWFERNQRAYNRFSEDFVLQGFNVEAKRVYPAITQKNLALAEKTFEQKPDLKSDDYFMVRSLIPALSKIHQKFAHFQAVTDLAAIACALERYRLANGKFPDKLDDLAPRFINPLPHDIIDGQPLSYLHRDDGQLLLYSVGWNEQDDNGEVARGENSLANGDWAWRFPAK